VKISKSYLLFAFWFATALMGLIPIACTNTSSNFNPTSPATPVVVSATATNAFGLISTATFTIQATSTPTNTPVVTPMTGSTAICTPNAPMGIAVNSTSLFVAGGDGTLSIYPIAGGSAIATINQFSLTGASFSSLAGVAVDSSGKLYILDTGGSLTTAGTVYEFDSTSSPVTAVNSWNNYNGVTFISPQGLAVDSNKNVYVVDTGNNVVDEFAPSGAASQLLGYTGGGGNGGLNNPTGISVYGTSLPVTVFVADMDDELIQEFNSQSGAFITQFSTPQESLPLVPGILGIGLDSNGNVFAADYNNSVIEEYHSGILSAQWNGPPLPTNPFSPSAVAVVSGSPDTIYVADYDNNAIYTVNP
jgi:hypothetical protein